MPAASAVMPSADLSAWTGRSDRCCSTRSTVDGFARFGCLAHMAGMSRSSGSVLSTLASNRIAETPSTRAWWVLWYIATRPSRSPSMTWDSHNGRSRARRVLCSRDVSSSSSRIRPGLGSALCRTWCSMSNCSSSSQTHCPTVRIDRCGRFRYSGAMSSTWRISSYISRT